MPILEIFYNLLLLVCLHEIKRDAGKDLKDENNSISDVDLLTKPKLTNGSIESKSENVFGSEDQTNDMHIVQIGVEHCFKMFSSSFIVSSCLNN